MAVRVVLVCKSLQQIRRSCGRSETLSLDAVVMNILACFRSEAYRCFSAFGNFMNLASYWWKWGCWMEWLEGNMTIALLSSVLMISVYPLCALN